MDANVIKQWDLYKDNLKKYISSTEQYEYDEYYDLVELIIDLVLNAGDSSLNLNIDNITVIDNGDYQGTQIFIIPVNTYQPGINDYYITYVDYGSCSGCDTLMGINYCNSNDLPNETQVSEYMTLCLHLIQRMKKLSE